MYLQPHHVEIFVQFRVRSKSCNLQRINQLTGAQNFAHVSVNILLYGKQLFWYNKWVYAEGRDLYSVDCYGGEGGDLYKIKVQYNIDNIIITQICGRRAIL